MTTLRERQEYTLGHDTATTYVATYGLASAVRFVRLLSVTSDAARVAGMCDALLERVQRERRA